MPTAQDLILAGYRRGRILGIDQVMSATRGALGLAALNRMLDSWSNDRLMVYQVQQENFPLVAGQASRTIGAGGNFNTTWPIKIVDGCFVRRAGIDYPVKVVDDRTTYDRIAVKTVQGIPQILFYDRAYPLGTIYFYFTPDAADTIYLNSWKRLAQVAALVTAITLPPGYEDLIVDGLAMRLCSDSGLSAPDDVRREFGKNYRNMKTVNAPSLVATVDPALQRAGSLYNIRTDAS